MFLFIYVLLLFQNVSVPYKASDEFEVKMELVPKSRYKDANSNTVEMAYEVDDKKRTTGIFPYLTLKVNLLKLSDQEIRARVVTSFNKEVYNKKVTAGTTIKLDMGFVQDIKEHLKPGEYNITLSSPKKVNISRIKIRIAPDGTYTVNGVLTGQF